VVLSVFIPSRVRLQFFPALEGDRHDTRALLDHLQVILDGRDASQSAPPGH
jgi:hypothetical protein